MLVLVLTLEQMRCVGTLEDKIIKSGYYMADMWIMFLWNQLGWPDGPYGFSNDA